MLFNRNFAFFQFLVNLPCYSMGILHFSQFSSIFYVIRWETCNFLLFCKFSMLFNGKHAFFAFLFFFPCYSMGSLHFVNFPCYSVGILGLRSLGGGWTYIRTDIWKFTRVLQDIGPLGPLPCSHSTSLADYSKQGIGYRWPCAILGWLVFT